LFSQIDARPKASTTTRTMLTIWRTQKVAGAFGWRSIRYRLSAASSQRRMSSATMSTMLISSLRPLSALTPTSLMP
jgi:hypothetical protein